MGVNTYSVREGRRPSYICNHSYNDGAPHTCQSMTSGPIDELVVGLFLEAIAPAQIKLALKVVDNLVEEKQALQQQWEQLFARFRGQLQKR